MYFQVCKGDNVNILAWMMHNARTSMDQQSNECMNKCFMHECMIEGFDEQSNACVI